jgi:quinol monooxygenase YgiN
MVTVGLQVTITAKPGKEKELAEYLRGSVSVAQAEPDTAAWFAIRLDDMTFGVFEVFGGQAGRSNHLLAVDDLIARAEGMLAGPPDVKPVDILAAKL